MTEVTNATNSAKVLKNQIAAIEETYGDTAKVFKDTFNFRTTAKLPDGAAWPAVTAVELGEDGEPVEVVKGYKRTAIELMLFRPSVVELARFMQDACPEQEVIVELVEDYIFAAAQKILGENPNMTAEDFPLDQIAFAALARAPKEVKARGLDAEELKAFCADYQEFMPEAGACTAQSASVAASIFSRKLAPVKTERNAQAKLRAYLDVYVASAPRAEQFQTVVSWLAAKLDEMLNAEIVELDDVL